MTPTGAISANIVKYRCFHGGTLQLNMDDVTYVGGVIDEGHLDICQFNMEKMECLVQTLGYYIGDVDCYFRSEHDGKIQVLCDDETIEQLRIQGVTYGEFELYFTHSPENNITFGELHNVNLNDEGPEQTLMMKCTGDIPVEIADLGTKWKWVDFVIRSTEAEMLPEAEHRLCARHIFTNWIKVIRGAHLHKLYWRAVKAYTEKEFNDGMEELKRQSQRAYDQMCARDVTKFCRRFYKTWACTDVTCNNMAETFNSWILEAREKPILSMLEEIRRKVMSRMVEKKVQATKCNGITPRIRVKLNDFRQATKNWTPIEANTNVYEVQHTHNSTLSYTVRLDKKECACRYWDVNGIPCEHATSAICAINQNPEDYVAFWYTKDIYEAAYSLSLEPLNGQALWEKVEGPPILPSDPRVKCGRPSNKRKRAYGDVRKKPLKYRVPKAGKQLCSNCQKIGHNRRKCPAKNPTPTV